MSFFISKVFWAFIQPSNLLVLSIMLTAVTLKIWPNFARRLLYSIAIMLFLITFLPFGQWLIAPVEQRFPEVTKFPASVDGIVVLGGGVEFGSSIGRRYLELNGAAERLIVSADLARQFPSAKLLYSGFRGRLVEESTEVPEIVDFYIRQGVEAERIIFESESRNTIENALFSKALANPSDGDTWLLVTSASHMPRAVGIFRKAGWPVVPVPVDFRRPRDPDHRSYLTLMAQPHLSNRLGELDHAAKAWAGLIAYRLMGRTNSVLPGPQEEVAPLAD